MLDKCFTTDPAPVFFFFLRTVSAQAHLELTVENTLVSAS